MADPKTGVKVADRKRNLRNFKNVFIGSEAVDWISNYLKTTVRPPSSHLNIITVNCRFSLFVVVFAI